MIDKLVNICQVIGISFREKEEDMKSFEDGFPEKNHEDSAKMKFKRRGKDTQSH